MSDEKKQVEIGKNYINMNEGILVLEKDGVTSTCPFAPLMSTVKSVITGKGNEPAIEYQRFSCNSGCPHFALKPYPKQADSTTHESKEEDVVSINKRSNDKPVHMLTLTCGRGVQLPIYEKPDQK